MSYPSVFHRPYNHILYKAEKETHHRAQPHYNFDMVTVHDFSPRLSSLSERTARPLRYLGYPGTDAFANEEWWDYEERVTPKLSETGVTTLCLYDPPNGNAEIWRRAEAVHPYVAKSGKVAAGGAAPVSQTAG